MGAGRKDDVLCANAVDTLSGKSSRCNVCQVICATLMGNNEILVMVADGCCSRKQVNVGGCVKFRRYLLHPINAG